jgi:endo-1,4-beta-xylanase
MQHIIILALVVLLLAGACSADGFVAGIDIGKDYEARVRSGIEHNRKSPATIEIVSSSGAKVAGAKVSVKQTSSDFLFGCAFPMWTEPPARLGDAGWRDWNDYFTHIFNYATTENSIKWGPMEPVEGQYHYESADFIAKWCKERNIKLKGHNLVWPLDCPEWVYRYPPGIIGDIVEKRIGRVMNRYRSDIKIWDVVNEPVHLHRMETAWSKDYVLLSYKWARAADPNATLVINDYANFRGAVDDYVPMVKDLLAKGAPIDAIGEQAHDAPYWYSPKDILETLNKMATTGLRIHLTELTYPSNNAKITGGFVQGKWDEQKQGEFYRYLLTLAFSHPNVDAITLWAMWDGSTWLKGGGIIREDWTPKPAYRVMDELINKTWKTRFDSRSDANGEVRFHGFHGDYEVTFTSPKGKTSTTTLHLSRGSEARLHVEM